MSIPFYVCCILYLCSISTLLAQPSYAVEKDLSGILTIVLTEDEGIYYYTGAQFQSESVQYDVTELVNVLNAYNAVVAEEMGTYGDWSAWVDSLQTIYCKDSMPPLQFIAPLLRENVAPKQGSANFALALENKSYAAVYDKSVHLYYSVKGTFITLKRYENEGIAALVDGWEDCGYVDRVEKSSMLIAPLAIHKVEPMTRKTKVKNKSILEVSYCLID